MQFTTDVFTRREIARRLFIAILLLAVVMALGSLGYVNNEDWSLLDALYMTVITVTTIGFKEVRELSRAGEVFTIILSLGGVGTAAYALSSVVSVVVGGHLTRLIKGQQMIHDIKDYKDHVVLCGCGKTGESALKELLAGKERVIVIETDADICAEIMERGVPVICDDATVDAVLEKARVGLAKGLIVSLPDDADNLFVTLSAREMAPDLCIVARASQKNSEKKLVRAGANKVIMADEIAGRHMANILLTPEAMSFVHEITGMRDRKVGLREITITEGCEWQGKTLPEIDVRAETGLNVVGIRHADGKLTVSPLPSTRMAKGDVLIVFGPIEAAEKINARFGK